MNRLEVTARDTTTGTVLEIRGELDHTTAAELREVLTTLTLQPGQRLLLDLAGMQFCDSSGIAAPIAARKHANTPGQRSHSPPSPPTFCASSASTNSSLSSPAATPRS
ncbi:STAS domain-containing protein [Streptomyces sp. NPDC101393]|uniref:STAS domain-containing protein n=1 Tax=Streptomyces sp. NPDC101393 TaxID=3366141 RepID=UPI0037F57915